jgi:hypothetical protein
MRQILSFMFFLGLGFGWPIMASAQPELCGPPPSLPVELQSDETIKGQLEGQARLLSGFVGKAELGGQVEATRKKLYQSSDKFFAAQKDAYLAYLFCIVVVQDRTTPFAEKITALQEFRKPVSELGKPPTPKKSLRDGTVIIIEIHIPKPRSENDTKFIKEVGETVSITLGKYDPASGQGKIASTSFGYLVDAFVAATDTGLRIGNSSPQGCSGSFQAKEDGVLHGRIACKWGGPFPTYDATIRLGG